MAEPAQGVIRAQADAVELDQARETAVLTGDVHFDDGFQRLNADHVTYDRQAGAVTAEGDVLLTRPSTRIAGEQATYQIDSGRARVEQAQYRLVDANARGSAEAAELLSASQSRYREITYTTCPPGNDDWLLSAKTLEVDTEEGLATAAGAKLRFKNVPIAYLPRFTYPIDDRRRSGFLAPLVGYSRDNGFDLTLPYYWNLAPNYDATIAPRLLSERGVGLRGQFRYLTPNDYGDLNAELFPNDRKYEGGTTRGALSFNHGTLWSPRFRGAIRFYYTSDADYLQDFGSSLAARSSRQLERAGELYYYGDDFSLLGRIQDYQTVDAQIPPQRRPYSRLPQILFDLERPHHTTGLTYHLRSEYAHFLKDDAVTGHRIDVQPGVSLSLRRPWGYLEPKVQARYTAYRLADPELVGLGDDSPDRALGIFSVDSGLYFDRSTSWFGNAVRQTLEPRLYYLYVPRRDQEDLPIFDTTELDFSIDNLFRDNRFIGADRQGDANQLAAALVSRYLDGRNGAEQLRLSIGQIYYFADREVTLPRAPLEGNSSSSLVGDVSARLWTGWRARAGLQWNPDDNLVEQAFAQVNYVDPEQRVINLAYRKRAGLIEQTDLAFLWPVAGDVRLIGRWYYSLREDRDLEAVAGLEYGRCCWRVRGVVRRFLRSDGDDYNLGFLMQLELFGLGGLGNDIEDFLERGIYGYRTEYDD